MGALVLVVDDDDDVRKAHARLIRAAGYDVAQAEDATAALSMLEELDPELLLVDLHMPGTTGIELLQLLRERDRSPPVIMISAAGTVGAAVKATQLGAVDFLEKPTSFERLSVSIANALTLHQLSREHARLRDQLGFTSELVGASAPMLEVRALIARVAPSEGRVLILGENGTGKELAANALHQGSARAERPFIKVNCGAIPHDLIESELFGHEKGAFTGALSQRRGKFELADKGTLFLDEIGDMPLAMQVKLLRFLQEGTFERVGGSRMLRADVRVIAATHRDLRAMVQSGTFREDLYYRLNVVTVTMPSLRQRKEDIAELSRVLLARAAERNGRRPPELPDDAASLLAQADYPGNVRELGNLMERLVILSDSARIRLDDVRQVAAPLASAAASERAAPPDGALAGGASLFRPGSTFRQLVQQAERAILEEAIASYEGNKSAAARALGMERAHFAKKCKAHGL